MKMNRILFLSLFLATTILFSFCISAAGKPAPQFQLPGLDGKIYSLSDFLGKPIIITFFTTKCGSCAEEFLLLNDIYHTYQASAGLQVVAINLGESEDAVKKMFVEIPYDSMTLLDQEVQLVGPYQIFGVPTAYFIDPMGNIADFIIGATNRKSIMKKLGRIMWYRGLRTIEIENLITISPQIEVLDLRTGSGNPYSDRANIKYTPVMDINQNLGSLDPNGTYLILSDNDGNSLKVCQQLALNGFQKVYYKINAES